MAESEPEAKQEEPATATEEAPEETPEAAVEQHDEKPPEDTPTPPAEQPEKLEEPIPIQVDIEKPEDTGPPEEETRRRSSTKRASIDAKAMKGMAVNQDTFVPPDAKGLRQSVSSGDRRRSTGVRRVSKMPSDRNLGMSPSGGRKSRFGGLSSKARMVLGSIVDIKANASEYYDKKTPKYQNTYKLESDNPFNPEKVDRILREVMQEVLENVQYDPEKCASAAKYASTQIRSKVKQLEFDRYKLVCIVSIGEKNSQDVYATCRFLWDPEKDRYSFYSLENTHVYAIAYCFGLYYE